MTAEKPGEAVDRIQITAPNIMWGPAATGIYIGVFDSPMRRHRIAATSRRWDYLEPPAGPGGHWAYALCEQPAWHSEIVPAVERSLPECLDCLARASIYDADQPGASFAGDRAARPRRRSRARLDASIPRARSCARPSVRDI